MKLNIAAFILISTSACLHAADNPHENRFKANRERLRTAPGKTVPELPHAKREQAPTTMQDLVDVVDDEAEFMKRLGKHLSDHPGNTTWDESCEGSCPTWDTEADWNIDINELPGFDQPITCKDYLGSCYQSLRYSSQEALNKHFASIVDSDEFGFSTRYPKARCKLIALTCQGANPNTISDRYNSSALDEVMHRNDVHLLSFFFAHGANANIFSGSNYLLHWAWNKPHIIQMLIDNGADVNARNGINDTPLHRYTIGNNADSNGDCIEKLITNRADANAKNISGHTPLLELARHCDTYDFNEAWLIQKKARLLFQGGARLYDQNSYGKTALEIARDQQDQYPPCKALADFLEDYEKQPNRVQE